MQDKKHRRHKVSRAPESHKQPFINALGPTRTLSYAVVWSVDSTCIQEESKNLWSRHTLSCELLTRPKILCRSKSKPGAPKRAHLLIPYQVHRGEGRNPAGDAITLRVPQQRLYLHVLTLDGGRSTQPRQSRRLFE